VACRRHTCHVGTLINGHHRTRNSIGVNSSRSGIHLLSSEWPWRHLVEQLCLCDEIMTSDDEVIAMARAFRVPVLSSHDDDGNDDDEEGDGDGDDTCQPC
jgi:hypothetical protein